MSGSLLLMRTPTSPILSVNVSGSQLHTVLSSQVLIKCTPIAAYDPCVKQGPTGIQLLAPPGPAADPLLQCPRTASSGRNETRAISGFLYSFLSGAFESSFSFIGASVDFGNLLLELVPSPLKDHTKNTHPPPS